MELSNREGRIQMRRIFILLTAVVCCLCLAACTEQAETGSTEGSEHSVPFGTQEGLTPGDQVLTPDEMPEKTDADYEVPPDNPLKGETS